MKKNFFLATILSLIIYSNVFANNNDCKEFKKFYVEYIKCKGNNLKDKTITTGKNIIKDTKD